MAFSSIADKIPGFDWSSVDTTVSLTGASVIVRKILKTFSNSSCHDTSGPSNPMPFHKSSTIDSLHL